MDTAVSNTLKWQYGIPIKKRIPAYKKYHWKNLDYTLITHQEYTPRRLNCYTGVSFFEYLKFKVMSFFAL